MSLRGLRAAMAVAEHRSTGAAARELHASQPATARAVAQLEQALGIRLFERSHRGMTLTLAGESLLKRGRATLAHLSYADAGPYHVPLRGGRLATQATTRQLEVVVHLAKAGSQRRVATQLGVSQASVQQVLAQVEHLAGGPLFDRLASGLRPTSRGDWVAHQAGLALAEMRAMAEDAAVLLGSIRGRLAIGTLPYSAGAIVSTAIQSVTSRWAGLHVSVVDGTYETLIAKLRRAEIDIVVGALRPEVSRDLRQVILFHDLRSIVVRAGHPLLSRRRLQLSLLSKAQWVLPMPGSPGAEVLEQTFAAQGLPMPEGVCINSPTLISAMVRQSDRLALMPPSQWQSELETGSLVALKIPVRHVPVAIGFTVRAGFAPTPVLTLFQEALQAAVR
ncbi:LysR family transcriptional regulator [Shinella sp.]|uniref:LysR family transcriptional regulator n=1 Tax=Shinella sp. TaxID=1870904 RepID=UPI0039E54CC0